MNDPRITDVVDATGLTDVPDSDILDAIIITLTGDPGVWGDISAKALLNKMVVSNSRPPASTDLITGFTQVYRDSQNQNMYISINGGDWQYQPTKGVRERVFIGTFTQTASSASAGEYIQSSSNMVLGASQNTPIYDNIKGIEKADKLFVGTKQLNVTSVSFASDEWTLSGDWENTFSGLTFAATESLYYTRNKIFLYEDIWEGRVETTTNVNTVHNLNAGKKFSDYDFLSVTYAGFNARHESIFPVERFEDQQIEFSNHNHHIAIIRNSDTSFRRFSGNGSAELKIVGIKAK